MEPARQILIAEEDPATRAFLADKVSIEAITTTPGSGRPTSTRSTRMGRSSGPASSCGCLPAIPGARRPRIRRRRPSLSDRSA